MIYVIINNSGKTAGMSLYKSFKKLPDIKAQHSHNICKQNETGKGFLRGKCVLEEVIKIKSDPRDVVYIFNVYRDIIDRKISNFFHNLEFHMKMNKSEILKIFENTKNVNFILERFYNLVYLLEEHNAHEQWEHLDYNVYQDSKFDKTNGFLVYQKENLIFVLLSYSKMKTWKKVLDTQLNNKKFTNLKIKYAKHHSKNKWYHKIYKEFYNKISISHATLDRIFEKHKKAIDFFMEDKEIEKMKKKWYRNKNK